MLALLREPALLGALGADPASAAGVVEEALRYDPPVQFRNRTCVEDIELGDTTIPAGSTIVLLLAAANRDPQRFTDPDTFDPARATAGHVGLGAGPHFCAGAGLARMEAQIALTALARRLRAPRLVADPPPYRLNAALRGPSRLEIAVSGIEPA
jgi:cytochrome P450